MIEVGACTDEVEWVVSINDQPFEDLPIVKREYARIYRSTITKDWEGSNKRTICDLFIEGCHDQLIASYNTKSRLIKVGIGSKATVIIGKKLTDKSIYPFTFIYSERGDSVKITVIGVNEDEDGFQFFVHGKPFELLPYYDLSRSKYSSTIINFML